MPNSLPSSDSDCERWLCSYLREHFGETTNDPVAGPWTRGQLLQAAGTLPEGPGTLAQTLAFFEAQIAPGLLRWNHPRFAAFFATSAPLPSIVAETLIAAHNSNVMLAAGSPAGAELETLVGQWYQQLLQIPEGLTAQFFTSASQSHQHALAAALQRATQGQYRRAGLSGQRPFALYTSELGHFLARKNAVAAGLGEESVRNVPADAEGAMNLAALQQMIDSDLAAGVQPVMVIATVGTTGITSLDDVAAIAQICRRHGIYCYVDAAYGGAFACLPECGWVTAGWELADAICVNPHKGLFVPQGCSVLFLRDREELRQVCSHRAEYIPESGEAVGDPMDYTFVCGLRVNTLASFFNFMTYGADGLRQRVRGLLDLATFAAQRIAADPLFELLTQPRFSTVCFTLRPNGTEPPSQLDARADAACRALQSAGRCWLSTTRYRNRVWFRVALGNIYTSHDDVTFILNELREVLVSNR